MTAKQPDAVGKPGKAKVRNDPRTLHLASFLEPGKLPRIPAKHDLIKKMRHPLRMMLNFNLHNCTCAAAAHMAACWTSHTGVEKSISDKAILRAYCKISGYNPVTHKNDIGACALDVLNYWRKTGIGRDKILAFASVNHRKRELVKQAVYLFGGVYAGLQLPKSIIGQKEWEIPEEGLKGKGRRGSFGGHAVSVLSYNQQGLTCISWGIAKKMSWAFWEAYADEAYALISKDFFKGKRTPNGFNLKTMEADLSKITRQKVTFAKQLAKLQDA